MKSRDSDDTGSFQALARRDEVIANGKTTNESPKLIGIAADHGGFALKQYLTDRLRQASCQVVDFGNRDLAPNDDYPQFVVPLARAVARREVFRGVAICGSGVGVCVAANKVGGVRACLLHDTFSAHQGVEDDDLNVICLGGLVVGNALAWELVQTFLTARFAGAERHRRRLAQVAELENLSTESYGTGAVKGLRGNRRL